MKYYTAYYWQDSGGEEAPYLLAQKGTGASMILEQYQCLGTDMCLIAICGNREICEELLKWREQFDWVKAAARPEKWARRAGEELEVLLRDKREARVLLGIGKEALLVGRYGKAYCICEFLGKGVAEELGDFNGELQNGTGILLVTEQFRNCYDPGRIGEVLRLKQHCTEERMARHLREPVLSAGEIRARGGAVLLIAK